MTDTQTALHMRANHIELFYWYGIFSRQYSVGYLGIGDKTRFFDRVRMTHYVPVKKTCFVTDS